MCATETIHLSIPKPYAFATSVCDHGWPALTPFYWDEPTQTLARVERLSSGQVVLLHLRAKAQHRQVQLQIAIDSVEPLSGTDRAEVVQAVRWMLKLDCDYEEFYALASHHKRIGRVVGEGRGRLLRSPTLWEDVVKTIATTNVTWRNTVSMIHRLVDTLGAPFPIDPTKRAFPTPQQVAAASPVLFADTIRMGYRNAYVQQLAQEIATGQRDLETLKTSALPTAELKKSLKSLKGIGDYAAHTLLMLLGHYGELPIDSEYRTFVARHYFGRGDSGEGDGGRNPTDQELAAVYDDWGQWKYLAYWFDHYD
ncbi:MAG: hypothetical protein R2932_23825 [Caldilineaceae bacterium]